MIKPKQKPNSTWLDALKGLAILGGIVWVAGWFIEGVNEAADQRVRDDVAEEDPVQPLISWIQDLA